MIRCVKVSNNYKQCGDINLLDIIYNSISPTTDKMQSKIVHLDYKGLVIYDAFGVITEHDTFDILTL